MGEKKNKRGAVGQKWTQVTGVGSGAQGERNSLLYACLCVCFRARERERERTNEQERGKGKRAGKKKKKTCLQLPLLQCLLFFIHISYGYIGSYSQLLLTPNGGLSKQSPRHIKKHIYRGCTLHLHSLWERK